MVGSAPTNNSVVLHDLQLFCVHGGQTSSHLMAKKATASSSQSISDKGLTTGVTNIKNNPIGLKLKHFFQKVIDRKF